MVKIITVKNNRELRKFVKFVNGLYKDNQYFVPDLIFDEVNTLRADKNPGFEFSEADFFLAYKDNKIVGRIGVIVNHKSNNKWDQCRARFTHFDFIDDYEVSSMLMETAMNWAKEKGHNQIHGPLGITDMDHQGMLVEGYEELDMFITIYNHPYYIDHMKKMGFKKEVDWIEYQIDVPEKPVEKYGRISEIVKKKYGYKLIEFTNKKDILPWAPRVFDLYNQAFAPLFGTTQLSKKQVKMYVDNFFGFVNPDFIKIILNKEDQIIGFAITIPSLSRAMQKAGGKLFPFGFIHILRALKKSNILDLYIIGVHPDYQGTGANALLINSIMLSAIKYKMKFGETGPELEDNHLVQTMWKYLDTRQHRRRRIFIKDIS